MTVWGTGGRPASPKEGEFGFNSETNSFEAWDGTGWNSISQADLSNYITKTEAIAFAIAL